MSRCKGCKNMVKDIISKDWTTRELKDFIRKETESVNYKMIDYLASHEEPNPVMTATFEKLKALGTGNVKAEYIGLGLSYKTKAELLQQARALQEANQADIYSDAAQKEYSEQEQAAYDTAIDRYGIDMTQDEYHDFVEAMGALETHINNLGLGSREILMIFNDAGQDKKINLVEEFQNTRREMKSGWTTKKFISRLRERMQGE